MYKKIIRLIPLYSFIVFNLFYISEAQGMFASTSVTKGKSFAIFRTSARAVGVKKRFKVQSHRYSSWYINAEDVPTFQTARIIQAFTNKDSKTIAAVLSIKSLENNIELLQKDMVNYQHKIEKLQEKSPLDLAVIRESLKSPLHNNEEDNTTNIIPTTFINIGISCDQLLNNIQECRNNYDKLTLSVNKFISNTDEYLCRISEKGFDAPEVKGLLNHAQQIKEKVEAINKDAFSEQHAHKIEALYEQKKLLLQSSLSNELTSMAEKIDTLKTNTRNKIGQLQFILGDSTLELEQTDRQEITQSKRTLEDKIEVLQRLATTTLANREQVIQREKRFERYQQYAEKLQNLLEDGKEIQIKYPEPQDIKHITDSIEKSYQDLEEKFVNLRLLINDFSKNIDDFVDGNIDTNLFYEMRELLKIKGGMQEINLIKEIEDSIRDVKSIHANLFSRRKEKQEIKDRIHPHMEFVKKVHAYLVDIIKKEENDVQEFISKNIENAINNNHQDLHEIKEKEKKLFSNVKELRKKTGDLLAKDPQATEMDFYEIAGIKTVRILSIDGGGVRGIIPSNVLKTIEEQTGRPVARQFDFMAGTSVGGLLTLALNVPNGQPHVNEGVKNTALRLAETAKKDAQRTFPRKTTFTSIAINFIGEKLWYWFGYPTLYMEGKKGAYSPQGLEEVCQRYLDDTLFRKAVSTVLIPAACIEDNRTLKLEIFNSKSEETNLYMKDLALATAAAPVYFPQKILSERQGKPYVDGGVLLNNPAQRAYQIAESSLPPSERERTRYVIISLGTGNQNLPPENNGLKIVVGGIMQSGAEEADRSLGTTFNNKPSLGIYKRINVPINKVELNDASNTTLDSLERTTNAHIVEEGKKDIDAVISLLKQKRPVHINNHFLEE